MNDVFQSTLLFIYMVFIRPFYCLWTIVLILGFVNFLLFVFSDEEEDL